MKKIAVVILIAALMLATFTFPAFAAEESNSESIISYIESLPSRIAESIIGFISDFIIWNLRALLSIENNKGDSIFRIAIVDGGFGFVATNGNINESISKAYNITYPIGLAVMLIGWGFGIAKSSINASLDIKDRNSIIHAVLGFVIGITAITVSPHLLSTLTGVSYWLYQEILNVAFVDGAVNTFDHIFHDAVTQLVGGRSPLLFGLNASVYAAIVIVIIDLVFMLNILWIALLQALSPIFIGCFASEGTKKISMNFIREYIKALLVPPVTLIYFWLSYSMVGEFGLFGIIGAIVLGISTLGIASKKLDKLIS